MDRWTLCVYTIDKLSSPVSTDTSTAAMAHPSKPNPEKATKAVQEQDLPAPGRLELFMAAACGEEQKLKQLVPIDVVTASEEGGSALVLTTEDRNSALHVVATGGDGAGYLKSAGVICDKAKQQLVACNKNGDTPLHCAARAGNTQMVSRLVELAKGVDGGDVAAAEALVRMQNNCGKTALHEAISSDDIHMVRDLMSSDRKLARVVAYDGTSPLFLAVTLGHHHVAHVLHDEYDKELSYSGPRGQNALHAAVLRNKKMARFLLDSAKGKKEELAGQSDLIWRSTPMHFAASAEDPSLEFFLFVYSSLDLYTFSLYYDAPRELLYKIYEWKRHPIILLADAAPSSVFQPDSTGWFPVHVAASAGSLVPIIILLYRSPGCAGLRDAQGRTFLHVAVEKKRLNVVRFVCSREEFKSIMNIQDMEGNTALHLAIHGGDWDIFRSLIWNKHVLLNLPDNEGRTPMDIADINAPSGFYFGLHARRRMVGTLTFANAQNGNDRRDRFMEDCLPKVNEDKESKKITQFAQIVGIGSVLVATATFAAAFTMPGGFRSDQATPPNGEGGTPMLAGFYAFDGFIVSNTLAFICSALATFSLVYTGVAAVDIHKRINLVSFSLALLISAARSFCAAFAFALYVLLAPVAHGAAIASCVMTFLALLDGVWFMLAILTDTRVVLNRPLGSNSFARLLKLGARFLANIVYLFWPFIVIFGLLAIRKITEPTGPLAKSWGKIQA